MNEKVKQALDLLEDLRKATLDTDIDSMGSLVQTNESCFENEINKLKDIVNDFDRYYESQQDLIKGKDEYIAKLCNDRAELKEQLKDLREFARIMASRRLINTRLQDSSVMFYDVEKRHSETEFDLVKRVVEKYGKE